MKHIVSESGGIGSYLTARYVVKTFGPENVIRLFADTKMEDEDLYRFLDDTEQFLGVPITKISEGRNVWEVLTDERMLSHRLDPCSKILKRKLLWKWITERYDPDECIVYLGIDWTEIHRLERVAKLRSPYTVKAPLTKPPLLNKGEMRGLVESDGLKIPRLYTLGFVHNNCGGFCIKAGQKQFKTLLEKMPERYLFHEEKEKEFQRVTGKKYTILRDRRGGTTKRMTLEDFRRRVENNQPTDEHDWGGCGCAID